MLPEVRKNKLLAEEMIHGLLKPLGFKKQKTNWRRRLPEVLQQFSLFHAPNGNFYRPEWGLNILSLRDDPQPRCNKLLVRWYYEPLITEKDDRMRIWAAFHLDSEISDEERREAINFLFSRWIIPCFKAFVSETAIKEMSMNPRHPLRTEALGYLPDSWLPSTWYRDPLLTSARKPN